MVGKDRGLADFETGFAQQETKATGIRRARRFSIALETRYQAPRPTAATNTA